MTWEPEIEEMQLRLDLAKKMGGEANIKRQHDGGKLTILSLIHISEPTRPY